MASATNATTGTMGMLARFLRWLAWRGADERPSAGLDAWLGAPWRACERGALGVLRVWERSDERDCLEGNAAVSPMPVRGLLPLARDAGRPSGETGRRRCGERRPVADEPCACDEERPPEAASGFLRPRWAELREEPREASRPGSRDAPRALRLPLELLLSDGTPPVLRSSGSPDSGACTAIIIRLKKK